MEDSQFLVVAWSLESIECLIINLGTNCGSVHWGRLMFSGGCFKADIMMMMMLVVYLYLRFWL